MNYKSITFLLLAIVGTLGVAAQSTVKDTTYWKCKYESSVTFSQTTFTRWAAGGENNVAGVALFNAFDDYKKGKVSWNNYLGLGFGLSQLGIGDNSQVRKIEDKINLLSKAGLYAWKNWDYTALFDFKTQFANGYSYPNDSVYVSKFLAPGYFQLSVGLNYKPNDYFSLFISPIGTRLTLVNDTKLTDGEVGAYGVNHGNTTLWQVGGAINMLFKKEIMKNVNYLSKLDVFSDYRRDPLSPVMSWDNNLLMKVNKYISVTLTTTMISDPLAVYKDKDNNLTYGPFQFRETFGVGFAYVITNQ